MVVIGCEALLPITFFTILHYIGTLIQSSPF